MILNHRVIIFINFVGEKSSPTGNKINHHLDFSINNHKIESTAMSPSHPPTPQRPPPLTRTPSSSSTPSRRSSTTSLKGTPPPPPEPQRASLVPVDLDEFMHRLLLYPVGSGMIDWFQVVY